MPDSPAQFDIGHPAPARDIVPLWRVVFGLLGAPAAWSLQLAATSAIGGLACLGPAGGRPGPNVDWAVTGLFSINLAAVLLAAAALAVAGLDYRRTRREEQHRSGHVMKAGEGRTRFLSVMGAWIGVLFLIATLASTISIIWRGACP
jgi:hypothetical protein